MWGYDKDEELSNEGTSHHVLFPLIPPRPLLDFSLAFSMSTPCAFYSRRYSQHNRHVPSCSQVSGYPTRSRVSVAARSHGEAHPLAAHAGVREHGNHADRVDGHDTHRIGMWSVSSLLICYSCLPSLPLPSSFFRLLILHHFSSPVLAALHLLTALSLFAPSTSLGHLAGLNISDF